jgi:aromatic-L-amino-acid/L-tryptophan decarboxylase
MLKLTPEEMRSLGYRVIDLLVEHFETLSDKPVTLKLRRAELEARLREPVPQQGNSPDNILDQLKQKIWDAFMHPDHPRFFAFIPTPSNFVSVMADALASGLAIFCGTWFEASGPAEIELVTIDWLRQACGFPAEAGGLFVSGGSVANITCLAVARHVQLQGKMEGAVIYCSNQTHSSIERGLRILGFQPDQLRKLNCDENFRIDLHELKSSVYTDRAAGKKPFCVAANAGSTNSGAIDPLPELSEFCKTENLWLHVDGSFGAAAVFSERGKPLLKGLGEVNSLAMDPHKWLFQPYEIGCVLVRNRNWLKQTFHILPEYMRDVEATEDEINFCDYGIQLTRSFRALKLWMSLKVFGSEAFAAAIDHGFQMGDFAGSLISEMKDWEIITPPQLAIINFRFAPDGISNKEANELNYQISQQMLRDGFAMIVTTEIRNKIVLRFCLINPRTTQNDVRETLNRLDKIARSLYPKR